MIQAGSKLDLSEESLGSKRRGEIGVQDFQRNESLVLCILREIHCRHSPTPKLAIDRVGVGERVTNSVEWCAAWHLFDC
jgi:hypothetical protein